MRRLLVLSMVTTLVLGSAPLLASADQGVSVGLGRIDITQKLAAGGRYHLPPLPVTNIGDQPERYEIAINYLQDTSDASRPPSAWFKIDPSSVDLAPGESIAIQLEVRLPTGARPGTYQALIEAQPAATLGSTKVGAAAATHLSFTIKPSSWYEAWLLTARETFADYEPWSYIIPALALSVFLLHGLRRRLKVHFTVERRR